MQECHAGCNIRRDADDRGQTGAAAAIAWVLQELARLNGCLQRSCRSMSCSVRPSLDWQQTYAACLKHTSRLHVPLSNIICSSRTLLTLATVWHTGIL